MNPLTKLIRGDDLRRTRLHDEKGNLIPLAQFVRVPEMIAWYAARRLFGVLPPGPWIPVNARAALERILRHDWVVVEYGSGMSTPWLAARVASVHSIESDRGWYERIRPRLPKNVRYELRDPASYPDLDEADLSIDLVVIDGKQRDRCATVALSKVRPGGFLYLDNSDKDMTRQGEGVREAERLILEVMRERGGESRYFTGLIRGNLSPAQGLLVRLD